MRMVIEICSRVIWIIYFLLMLVMSGRQIQVKLLSNTKYALYSNYVKERNQSLYDSVGKYYKALVKGWLIQGVFIVWAGVVIHQMWFTIISIIALVTSILEEVIATYTFPAIQDFTWKDWVILIVKRGVGIIGDCYLVIGLIAMCFIY